MRVVSIRDVLRMDKGDTVDAVKGEIKTIYKSQNVGKRGGTLQTIVLTDGRDDIKAKLWDREEDIPSSWKGRFIHIVASGDRDRDALTVDEYKDEIQLNVPKTAEIAKGKDMGDDDREQDRDERGKGRDDDRSERRERDEDDRGKRRDEPDRDERKGREREREPEKEDLEDPKVASRNVTLAKLEVARCANLYKVALMAADHVAAWWKDKGDTEMESELYKAMAHGFYMDLLAADHIERMPVHDITEYLVPKPKRKEKAEKSEKTQQEAEGGAA